jgi:hypothetical protein
MVPDMIHEQCQKWQQGEMNGQVTQATVPGENGEDKKRGGERSRKSKTAECFFQRWIDGDLDQGENKKPAYDRKDLQFNAQVYPLR